ncbi:HPr(Ser) kinase/phosphatase [Intestinibacter sp.]|uniref:HPr(Ser) kinase/phosphatase n=1 Tax=Intestinibacter sp. TaxID=1965304 RepID=UPI002A747655|nr:HPr(Ser) kinase/phosphatase [Intestinibacter sp.]MDY2735221.1 HPr(Ser) kinase/phosphatase [Intestinibacter sp.]MDY4573959.1 HPr(Ser) kinase/phosphatase [Intestinibacter sp.]
MESQEKVAISDIVRDLDLNVIYQPEDKEFFVHSQDVNRTGLALAGYFEYFSFDRIQIIGKGEYTYFKNIDKERRREILDKLFSYDIPALVITRGLEVDEDIIEAAKRHERVLISSERNTTRFINKISNYLDHRLAPRVTIHGVLVDVYGIGVLIKGESSIGKSETALELIQRGHRLVADDAVEIIKLDDDRLVGQAPELLRHYMEIRGIGIIDVRSLYGVGAVKNMKEISLILQLENWNQEKYYDRLGLDKEYEKILDKEIEKLVVPVKPGRNTAMIVEVAAMNHRQKIMGYDSAVEFTKKLAQTIQK